MYIGSDLQWRVNGLESRADFTIRVAAVRVPPDSARPEDEDEDEDGGGCCPTRTHPGSPRRRRQLELVGAWSPPCVFATLDGGAGGGAGGGSGGGGGFGAGGSAAGQLSGSFPGSAGDARGMAGFLPTVRGN